MTPLHGSWIDGRDSAVETMLAKAGLGVIGHAGGASPHFRFSPSVVCSAEARRTTIVADMRLDNRRELAKELGLAAGDRSMADAMLVVKAWERWGIACFQYLEGAFALALWDAPARRLILARDPTGHRPLYLRPMARGVIFGSDPLHLAAVHGQPVADLDRLAGFLALLPDYRERSFIAGVDRVLPGGCAIVDSRRVIRHHEWWQPPETDLRLSYGEAVEAVEAEFSRSVQAALETDGPVIATELSGGLDSTAVSAFAAERTAPARLVAITGDPTGPVDPPPPGLFIDEPKLAASSAGMLAIRHVRATAPPRPPLDALDDWLPFDRTPTLNPCNLPWVDAVYAVARDQGAAVLLTGAAGNGTISQVGERMVPELARSGRLAALAHEVRCLRRRGAKWKSLAALAFGDFVPEPLWTTLGGTTRKLNLAQHALMRPGNDYLAGAETQARSFGYDPGLADQRSARPRLRRAAL
ncbi:MAG: asparagine synthase-related protein, partial [Sphingomicrobium sp.]